MPKHEFVISRLMFITDRMMLQSCGQALNHDDVFFSMAEIMRFSVAAGNVRSFMSQGLIISAARTVIGLCKYTAINGHFQRSFLSEMYTTRNSKLSYHHPF